MIRGSAITRLANILLRYLDSGVSALSSRGDPFHARFQVENWAAILIPLPSKSLLAIDTSVIAFSCDRAPRYWVLATSAMHLLQRDKKRVRFFHHRCRLLRTDPAARDYDLDNATRFHFRTNRLRKSMETWRATMKNSGAAKRYDCLRQENVRFLLGTRFRRANDSNELVAALLRGARHARC